MVSTQEYSFSSQNIGIAPAPSLQSVVSMLQDEVERVSMDVGIIGNTLFGPEPPINSPTPSEVTDSRGIHAKLEHILSGLIAARQRLDTLSGRVDDGRQQSVANQQAAAGLSAAVFPPIRG